MEPSAEIVSEATNKVAEFLQLKSRKADRSESTASERIDVLTAELNTLLQGVEHDVSTISPTHSDDSPVTVGGVKGITSSEFAAFSISTRAALLFLKGKFLLSSATRLSEAEALLAKAVKLDPSNMDAWNCLGNVYTELGKLSAARECFEGAVAQKPTPPTLRDLSVILRKLGTTAEERVENTNMSLQRAKEAVALDFKDGESWTILGNSYLSLFFSMSHKLVDLEFALKAYGKAVALAGPDSAWSADLFYNRAQVHSYLENYTDAIEDLMKAHALDPDLNSLEQCRQIEQRRCRAADFVAKKGRVKAKKLALISKSFQDSPGSKLVTPFSNYSSKTVSELGHGTNENCRIEFRFVTPLSYNSPPIAFLAVDAEENFCIVSVYHLEQSTENKIKAPRDSVTVLNPYLVDVEFEHEGNTQQYKLVQVRSPHQFYVNGKLLQLSFAHEAMATQSPVAA